MKVVSVHELKRNLSRFLAMAAAGTRVLVTRHRKPVAELGPAELANVHVGSRFGRGKLRPAVPKAATSGWYLRYLSEDRRGGKADR